MILLGASAAGALSNAALGFCASGCFATRSFSLTLIAAHFFACPSVRHRHPCICQSSPYQPPLSPASLRLPPLSASAATLGHIVRATLGCTVAATMGPAHTACCGRCCMLCPCTDVSIGRTLVPTSLPLLSARVLGTPFRPLPRSCPPVVVPSISPTSLPPSVGLPGGAP